MQVKCDFCQFVSLDQKVFKVHMEVVHPNEPKITENSETNSKNEETNDQTSLKIVQVESVASCPENVNSVPKVSKNENKKSDSTTKVDSPKVSKMPELKRIEIYSCDICDFTTYNESDLTKHVNLIHENIQNEQIDVKYETID